MFFFFFSSRRRHTRSLRDWSSDVCSSDLSPVNQRVAVGMLKRLGVTASVASNGREALDMLDEQRFDAILMDCLMPEMDGFEATEELRQREVANGQRRTPVIALTASALASDRERCTQAGMDDFLTKPIHGHDLRAT